VKPSGDWRLRRRALAVLAATLFATAVARAESPAAPPARRLGPPDLRDQFQKADKSLRKAENALGGHDAGRVSLLLQRADEEIVTFEQGSGLGDFVRETGDARRAATAGDMTAADRAVRRARAVSVSLADYTVARPAEVAYRSALAAIGDRSGAELLTALDVAELTRRFDEPAVSADLRDALVDSPAELIGGNLGERLDEKVFAPHDRFIDTEVFLGVIDAVLEDAFPAGRIDGKVFRLDKRVEYGERCFAVGFGALRRFGLLGQIQQPAGGDGAGGGFFLGAPRRR
jgi:hypothetical protein